MTARSYDSGSVIRRALVVVEFANPGDPHNRAMVVTQSGGDARFTYEDDQQFGYFDGRYGYREVLGPKRHHFEINGYGKVTMFANADDLFRQWRGEQPTPPPAIEPHRPELGP